TLRGRDLSVGHHRHCLPDAAETNAGGERGQTGQTEPSNPTQRGISAPASPARAAIEPVRLIHFRIRAALLLKCFLVQANATVIDVNYTVDNSCVRQSSVFSTEPSLVQCQRLYSVAPEIPATHGETLNSVTK